MTRIFGLAAAIIITSTSVAMAHHPLGGMTPQTALHGFLSGIGHPLIGFDHLAFIVGVALIAAFHRARLFMPVAFVVGTIAGTMLALAAVSLPLAEVVIIASVMIAGAVVMRGKATDIRAAAALAAGAGLFHGWAYGAAVVGAEPTPIITYLVGFAVIQMAIAIGVTLFSVRVWKALDAGAMQPRLAGAVVAGAGLTYMVEIVEPLIFSAM